MALKLKNIFTPGSDEIAQTYTIESWHVSQSIDAFTGAVPYDITLTGSFTLTGSQFISGSIFPSLGANTVGFFGTSSWAVSSSKAITSSYADTSSIVLTGSTSTLDYGLFVNIGDQPLPAALSGSILFDTIIVSSSISMVGNDTITVTKDGLYNIEFTLLMENSALTARDVYVWLIDSALSFNIPNSNKIYSMRANSKLLATGGWLANLTTTSTYKLWWWSASDLNLKLMATSSAAPYAFTPSSTLKVIQIK
jgi:hypothetical protein